MISVPPEIGPDLGIIEFTLNIYTYVSGPSPTKSYPFKETLALSYNELGGIIILLKTQSISFLSIIVPGATEFPILHDILTF